MTRVMVHGEREVMIIDVVEGIVEDSHGCAVVARATSGFFVRGSGPCNGRRPFDGRAHDPS